MVPASNKDVYKIIINTQVKSYIKLILFSGCTDVIHFYLTHIVDIDPCCNGCHFVKRSKICSNCLLL